VEISPYNVGDYATFGKVINTGIGMLFINLWGYFIIFEYLFRF
jgi:hypothetical protein